MDEMVIQQERKTHLLVFDSHTHGMLMLSALKKQQIAHRYTLLDIDIHITADWGYY
jgi:hypothetical protein